MATGWGGWERDGRQTFAFGFGSSVNFAGFAGRAGRAPVERLGGLGGAAEEASDGSVFRKLKSFRDNTPVYPYCSSEKGAGFGRLLRDGRCSVGCVVDVLPPGAAVLPPPSQRCDISQTRIRD